MALLSIRQFIAAHLKKASGMAVDFALFTENSLRKVGTCRILAPRV